MKSPMASEEQFPSIDGYKIEKEIGRGGMGVVYLAWQISLERNVALKCILRGALAGPNELRRFRAEAQIAAGLKHVNIVTIHEVGESHGVPFFSMDYIQGQNLSELTRDNPLPASKAAEYLRTIAVAVAFAHSTNVLHRDLKPSNVIIDRSDQPIVTDFGLAKRLAANIQLEDSQTDLTATGFPLGTPNFMPPEQALADRGRIGPTSDIYSIGAILYHLLTGRPPFLAETLVSTLRLVTDQEPVSPRLLNPSIPRDLETICLKCLQKEPHRRFQSAQELVDELNRFLSDKPILSRPAGVVERLWRWYGRNRALGTALLTSIGLLLVVAVGSPLALFRIYKERNGAFEARKQAQIGEKKARTEAARSDEVAQFLKDMLKGAGPAAAMGRNTEVLHEILDKTEARLGKDLKDEPAVAAELQNVIGEVHWALGDYERAENLWRANLTTVTNLLGLDHPAAATALDDLGVALYSRGKLAEAENLERRALEIRRRLLRREHRDIAVSLNNIGLVLRDLGKLPEAEEMLREGLEMSQHLPGTDDDEIATSFENLAIVIWSQYRFAEAETQYREALKRQTNFLGDAHPHIAISLNNLALVLRDKGSLAEAEDMSREALKMQGKFLPHEHAEVASFLDSLALILRDREKLSEAENVNREALKIRLNKLGTNHQDVASSLHNLAVVLHREGDLTEAEATHRKALGMRRGLLGDWHSDVAESLEDLALVLLAQQKAAEAEEMIRECLRIRTKASPDEWPTFLVNLTLAECLLARKEYLEAEQLLLPSYKNLKSNYMKIPAWSRPRLERVPYQLFNIYELTGQQEKATEWKKELDALRKKESPG